MQGKLPPSIRTSCRTALVIRQPPVQLDVVRHRNGTDFAPVNGVVATQPPPVAGQPVTVTIGGVNATLPWSPPRQSWDRSGASSRLPSRWHSSRRCSSAHRRQASQFPSTPLTARRPPPPSVECASLPGNAVPLLLGARRSVPPGPETAIGCRRRPIRPMRKTLTPAATPWLHPHPTAGRVQPNHSPTPKKSGSRGCDLAPYTRAATRLGLGPTGVDSLVSVRRLEA